MQNQFCFCYGNRKHLHSRTFPLKSSSEKYMIKILIWGWSKLSQFQNFSWVSLLPSPAINMHELFSWHRHQLLHPVLSQPPLKTFPHCRRRDKQPLSPSPFWFSRSGCTLALPDIKKIWLALETFLFRTSGGIQQIILWSLNMYVCM